MEIKKQIIKKNFIIITGIMIVTSLLFILLSLKTQKADQQAEITHRNQSIKHSKETILGHLHRLETVADSVALLIREGQVTIDSISPLLEEYMHQNPKLYELAIAFEDSLNQDKSTMLLRIESSLETVAIPYNYRDTLAIDNINRNWYLLSMKTGKRWNEPYYGTAAKSWLTELSVPFYLPTSDTTQKPDGIICIAYSLDNIVSFMDTLPVNQGGYAFILSQQGYFLYYPQKEFVTNHYNIDSLVARVQKSKKYSPESKKLTTIVTNGNKLKEATQMAQNGHRGSVKYTSIVTDQSMKLYFEPIEGIDWTLFSLVLEKQLTQKSDRARSYTIITAIIITITILSILLLLSLHFHKTTLGVIAAVVVLILATCYIWIEDMTETTSKRERELPLTNAIETQKAVQKFNRAHQKENFCTIPTGIFIQTLEFANANNFKVSGYVWQRYKKECPMAIDTGIIFPEATTIKLERAYRHESSKEVVVGWHFSGTIRERFDYLKFPFDKEQLWLRMWHKNFDQNVMLVPDLQSYDRVTPQFKPGLEETTILPGWEIEKSYFSYNYNSYNSNFGISSYSGQVDFPELYFNIGVQRNFFNALISHLIPLLVIYLMLYSVLHIARNSDEKGLFGFSSLSGMRATTAMFLVAIFKHISLRNDLNVTGVVYFEWFYFITYILILYVSLNAIIIAQEKQWKFIQYRDNYFSRILFWPITFLMLFIATAGVCL